MQSLNYILVFIGLTVFLYQGNSSAADRPLGNIDLTVRLQTEALTVPEDKMDDFGEYYMVDGEYVPSSDGRGGYAENPVPIDKAFCTVREDTWRKGKFNVKTLSKSIGGYKTEEVYISGALRKRSDFEITDVKEYTFLPITCYGRGDNSQTEIQEEEFFQAMKGLIGKESAEERPLSNPANQMQVSFTEDISFNGNDLAFVHEVGRDNAYKARFFVDGKGLQNNRELPADKPVCMLVVKNPTKKIKLASTLPLRSEQYPFGGGHSSFTPIERTKRDQDYVTRRSRSYSIRNSGTDYWLTVYSAGKLTSSDESESLKVRQRLKAPTEFDLKKACPEAVHYQNTSNDGDLMDSSPHGDGGGQKSASGAI